jgi:hypothetical protein
VVDRRSLAWSIIAEMLAQLLKRERGGVRALAAVCPIGRSNSYSATIHDRNLLPLLTRTNQVLGVEIPIVIINGMAKANPTVDEVTAEFRGGK